MNDIVIEMQDFTKTYDGFIAVARTIFDVKNGKNLAYWDRMEGEKPVRWNVWKACRKNCPAFGFYSGDECF